MTPWLSTDYIREAYMNEEGRFVLLFTDGIKNIYSIDDCTKAQVGSLLEDLEKKGITVRSKVPTNGER